MLVHIQGIPLIKLLLVLAVVYYALVCSDVFVLYLLWLCKVAFLVTSCLANRVVTSPVSTDVPRAPCKLGRNTAFALTRKLARRHSPCLLVLTWGQDVVNPNPKAPCKVGGKTSAILFHQPRNFGAE